VGSPELKASLATVKKGQPKKGAQSPVSSPKNEAPPTSTTKSVISYFDSDEGDDLLLPKKKAAPASNKQSCKEQEVGSPVASGNKRRGRAKSLQFTTSPLAGKPESNKKAKAASSKNNSDGGEEENETALTDTRQPAQSSGDKSPKGGGHGSKSKKGCKGEASAQDVHPPKEAPLDIAALLKKVRRENGFKKEMQELREGNEKSALEAAQEKKKAALHEKESKQIDKDSGRRKSGALAPGSSRKDKKEATAAWMDAYEDNGMVDGKEVFNGMQRFYDAQDYLKKKLKEKDLDVAALQRNSVSGYTDDFTNLMVEKKLGFDELHESEKQKINKAAQEYFCRNRRK
jgi:hypothetical protein